MRMEHPVKTVMHNFNLLEFDHVATCTNRLCHMVDRLLASNCVECPERGKIKAPIKRTQSTHGLKTISFKVKSYLPPTLLSCAQLFRAQSLDVISAFFGLLK